MLPLIDNDPRMRMRSSLFWVPFAMNRKYGTLVTKLRGKTVCEIGRRVNSVGGCNLSRMASWLSTITWKIPMITIRTTGTSSWHNVVAIWCLCSAKFFLNKALNCPTNVIFVSILSRDIYFVGKEWVGLRFLWIAPWIWCVRWRKNSVATKSTESGVIKYTLYNLKT